MKPRMLAGIFAFCFLLSHQQDASGVAIDFDSQGYTGPSLFASASPNQGTLTIGDATFRGGAVLTNATNFPTNTTSVYGTAGFAPGMSRILEIDFTAQINNIYFNLYNGWTTDMSYRIYDNAGNSAIYNLASNMNHGQSLVEFAAAGTKIFIECTSFDGDSWDFLIDNIHYNEELPSSVPEPSTFLLLGAGLAGIGFLKRKVWG